MAETADSWAVEIAATVADGESGDGNGFPVPWIRFQQGTHPGIHPERWPDWVPGELIPFLSRDERAVSVLFSGKDGAPGWTPSWHLDGGHPVIRLINEDPSILPRLHCFLSAAAVRQALPLVISSDEKKALLAFLGEEMLSKALYILPRMPLPSLDRWIGDCSSGWPGVEEMARKGASILLASIAEAPRTYRKQVLLALPKIAGDLDSLGVPDHSYRGVAKEFVLCCVPLARNDETPVAMRK